MTISNETVHINREGLNRYIDTVLSRRSIRKLTTGPIDNETIGQILEAARWSPTSGNSQPVRVVALKERNQEFWDFVEATLKQKLQGDQLQRAVGRIPGYRAGLFTLVFFEDSAVEEKLIAGGMPAPIVKSFSSQALGIVQANVWNAITAAGLAASNQHFNYQIEAELKDFLNVPASWKSYSVFPVGYADETPAEGSRHEAKHVIFFEHGPEVAN